MKKIISMLIVFTMLFSAMLAVVPASAEEEDPKVALKALMDEIEALDSTKYTEASWKSVESALNGAKKVYDDAASLPTHFKINLQTLQSAYDKLVVDTSALKALIDEAKALVETDYTEDSWAAFQETLALVEADAKTNDLALIEAAAVTIAEALETALVALPVENDAIIAELDKLVKLAYLLDPTDYSTSAWGMVNMKLIQAEETIEKPTISGYDLAVQQLETALTNLTVDKVLPLPEIPDVEPLITIIDYIDKEFTEDMFTAESWANLMVCYEDAVALRDAGLAHEELYDTYKDLYKDYVTARDNYILYADEIDKAQSRYDEAVRKQELGEATADDVAAALEVLEAAKADAAAPKAERDEALAAVDEVVIAIIDIARSPDEVEPVFTDLNEARMAMVLKPEEPTEAPVVTEAPTAAPTEAPTAAPTDAPVATEAPAETGCGAIVGVGAVVVTAILGFGVAALRKKD